MAQARLRRDAGPRDGPALRAALARRPRAPHRTPVSTEHEAAPRSSPGRCSQLIGSSPSTALSTAGGRRVQGCRKPQPSPWARVALSDPWTQVPYRHRSRSPSQQRTLAVNAHIRVVASDDEPLLTSLTTDAERGREGHRAGHRAGGAGRNNHNQAATTSLVSPATMPWNAGPTRTP
jgi:hypothetical protein